MKSQGNHSASRSFSRFIVAKLLPGNLQEAWL